MRYQPPPGYQPDRRLACSQRLVRDVFPKSIPLLHSCVGAAQEFKESLQLSAIWLLQNTDHIKTSQNHYIYACLLPQDSSQRQSLAALQYTSYWIHTASCLPKEPGIPLLNDLAANLFPFTRDIGGIRRGAHDNTNQHLPIFFLLLLFIFFCNECIDRRQ